MALFSAANFWACDLRALLISASRRPERMAFKLRLCIVAPMTHTLNSSTTGNPESELIAVARSGDVTRWPSCFAVTIRAPSRYRAGRVSSCRPIGLSVGVPKVPIISRRRKFQNLDYANRPQGVPSTPAKARSAWHSPDFGSLRLLQGLPIIAADSLTPEKLALAAEIDRPVAEAADRLPKPVHSLQYFRPLDSEKPHSNRPHGASDDAPPVSGPLFTAAKAADKIREPDFSRSIRGVTMLTKNLMPETPRFGSSPIPQWPTNAVQVRRMPSFCIRR